VLVAALALGALIYLAAPIVVVVLTSFTSTGYLVFPPRGFSLAWYQNIARNPEFVGGFITSVELAVAVVVIACPVAIPAAIAIVRRPGRLMRLLEQVFLSPIVLPAVVLGVAYLALLQRHGLLGTFSGALLAHVVLATPFVIRSVGDGLATMNPSLEEAANSLGAGPLRTFFWVTFPLIQDSLLAGAIFAFIISFDEAVVTLFLVGPHFATLPVRIFTYMQYSDDPTVAAVSTVLIGISMLFVLLLGRVATVETLL
jgi:putative spermidine/putrescine transport system permease protein